jgi:hypothetical protein
MPDSSKRSDIVEKVVAELDARAASLKLRGDPREIFTLIYKEITDRMLKELINQEITHTRGFNDPLWLANLDRRFAEYYLKALDAFDENHLHTPRVWKAVFEAIDVGRSTTASLSPSAVLRALLQPMMAHIRHDLVFALHDLKAAPDNQADHEKVTDLLCAEIDNVQETKGSFAPLLKVLDEALGGVNEKFTCDMVRRMRQEAWDDAQALQVAQSEAERTVIRKSVEEKTLIAINEISEKIPFLMIPLNVFDEFWGLLKFI